MFTRLVLASLLAVLTAAAAQAGFNFSTGTASYTVMSGPTTGFGDAMSQVLTTPTPAVVVTDPNNDFPFGPGGWVPNSVQPGGFPTSVWVGPTATPRTQQYLNNATVPYVYRTTFDLTAAEAATASLSGIVAADNGVTVFLNGFQLASYVYPDNDYRAYIEERFTGTSTTPQQVFSATSSQFATTNILEFHVLNSDDNTGATQTGLRVAGLVTAAAPSTATPAPLSAVVLLAGFGGLAAVRRRRA